MFYAHDMHTTPDRGGALHVGKLGSGRLMQLAVPARMGEVTCWSVVQERPEEESTPIYADDLNHTWRLVPRPSEQSSVFSASPCAVERLSARLVAHLHVSCTTEQGLDGFLLVVQSASFRADACLSFKDYAMMMRTIWSGRAR